MLAVTPAKRAFDLGLAVVLGVVLAPLLLVLLLVLLIVEGRPVFYVSERMKTPDQPFGLIKLRTMRPAADEDGQGVTGGNKSDRIGPLHRVLRKTRLDEIPQLWNVIRGDMSFVGPRPPLRVYTRAFPDLYADVLRSRPGMTGLASLVFHKREADLLAGCDTAAETDAVYRRRCVPVKARLDLIYQRQASICFDLVILWRTLKAVLR